MFLKKESQAHTALLTISSLKSNYVILNVHVKFHHLDRQEKKNPQIRFGLQILNVINSTVL